MINGNAMLTTDFVFVDAKVNCVSQPPKDHPIFDDEPTTFGVLTLTNNFNELPGGRSSTNSMWQ